jgi:hypothetical protein
VGNITGRAGDVKRRPRNIHIAGIFLIQSEFSRNPWNVKVPIMSVFKNQTFYLTRNFCLKSKIF